MTQNTSKLTSANLSKSPCMAHSKWIHFAFESETLTDACAIRSAAKITLSTLLIFHCKGVTYSHSTDKHD